MPDSLPAWFTFYDSCGCERCWGKIDQRESSAARGVIEQAFIDRDTDFPYAGVTFP